MLGADEQRELHVSALSGNLCAVVAWLSWSVLELKSAIERSVAIPALEQTLVSGTSELDDDDRLFKVLPVGAVHVTLVRRHPLQVQCLQTIAKCSAIDLLYGSDKVFEELCTDRVAALALVRRDGRLLGRLPGAFKADRGVVLATLRRYPSGLQHAAQALRDDPDLVRTAVRYSPHALEFASGTLRASNSFISSLMEDEDFVDRMLANPKEALQWARTVLGLASPALQKEPHLCHIAGLQPPPSACGKHAG